jgi:hypothetical protein
MWEAQKVVTVSQVIQKNGFTMQVGLPFLGRTVAPSATDIRFMGCFALNGTFLEINLRYPKGILVIKYTCNGEVISN